MKLRPYTPQDFAAVQSWILSEREHALWCANTLPYPLSQPELDATLQKGWHTWGDRPYIAVDESGQAVGFLVRNPGFLKYVLVSPQRRGQSIGTQLIRCACQMAQAENAAAPLRLNVFAENTRAVRCYTRAGFETEAAEREAFAFHDERLTRLSMIWLPKQAVSAARTPVQVQPVNERREPIQ